LNEFSLLCVLNQIGAFMDWGMEKYYVPFKERRPMEKLLGVPLHGRENQSFGGFQ
jgi:hypothetical protein